MPHWDMTSHIRLATPADASALARIYHPAVAAAAISFEVDAPDPEEMANRVVATITRTPWLVCATADAVLGYAYASRHRDRAAYQWSVDVSVYVDDTFQRLGIGRSLYRSLFAVLTLQGFYRAYAGITLPNVASVGFHESMGFRRVGVYHAVGYKQGAWHDVAWYERQLQPTGNAPPATPRPLAELLNTSELDRALGADNVAGART
jgi:L-amino acid N-acyltransferase YncA